MSSPESTDPNASSPAPAAVERNKARTVATVVLAIAAGGAALYFGRELFVPIALAMLLAVLLRPVVRFLERLHIHTAIGATLVTLGLIAVLAGLIYAASWSVQKWMNDLPGMLDQASAKFEKIRRPIQKVTDVVEKAQHAAQGDAATKPTSRPTTTPTAAATPGDGGGAADAGSRAAGPAPVPAPQAPGLLAGVLGTTTGILTALIEVLLLLFLVLAAGQPFVRKIVRLIPGADGHAEREQMACEIGRAVNRYMVVTALLAGGEGVCVGLALWALKVPSPWLWAALAVVMEFVPYLGATVMTALLSLVAFTTFDHLGHILAVPGSFLLISALQNNVASPLMYGKGLKLNPVAVLLAVMVWGFLWGVVGAFLAVPIVAACKIVADRVAMLRPLGEFLGE